MARLPQRLGANKKAKAALKPKEPTPESVADSASSEEDADIPFGEDEDASDAEGDDESGDDDEDEGVDEVGMKRLMTALGEDGLDDFELAQLGSLRGDEDEGGEGGEDESNNEDSVSEEEKGEEGVGALSDEPSEDGDDFEDDDGAASESLAGEEEEDAVALDDVDSVDEDAVPRQKIEIDNTVRALCLFYSHSE
jgi:rRNA-processing protein EBP2